MGELLSMDQPVNLASLRAMADGLAFFPRRVDLAKKVAEAYARLGQASEADGVLQRSFDLVSDPAVRAELSELQRKLTGEAAD